MTFLFVGGEDSDFNKSGSCSVDTAKTAARRTSKARCSLKIDGVAVGDGWQAVFSAAASSFWVTGRGYFTYNANVATNLPSHMLALLDASGIRRLALVLPAGVYTANNTKYWRLVKIDAAGTMTTLATAGNMLSTDLLQKVDVYVNYAVAGQVQVYLDGTKIIDYAGDVTTNSATAMASAVFGQDHAAGATVPDYWSEIIVSTNDTRSLSLATLTPAAAGNTFNWTGATSDINELTLDDATLITSAMAGQIAETTVTTTALSGTTGIVAVVVNARAQKGGTGPQNADLMVRTGGVDYVSADIALSTSLSLISKAWDTNPATGSAWVASDLTATGFNVGIKSVA